MSGKYNITAPQGSTFNLSFNISTNGVDWNLTGYSAAMQVRYSPSDTVKILDLSTANGNMTVNGTGDVTATATATEMAGINPGRWVYDIELTSGDGTVTRILEGKFIVTAEVTK